MVSTKGFRDETSSLKRIQVFDRSPRIREDEDAPRERNTEILWSGNYSNSPAILLQYVDGYLFGDFSGKGRHDILRYDEEIMTCEKLIEDYHQRWVLEGAKPPTNSVELKNLENSLNEKRRAREEFYKKNSEENNVFITGMKKLASALTSAGITGDFNGSNIICDKESLAQPGMVHIIDFAEQEEGQTNESIMKDNNTSINSLLFEYGLINSRGS